MIICGFKELEDMGMEGLTIMEACMRSRSLEEGWESEAIGS